MNKYIGIFKTSFKQEKDTIVDTLFRCFAFILIIYILLQLWKFIYGDTGTQEIINGYSLQQMLWYLIIAEIITCCAKINMIGKTISHEIKSGSIAYKINKPYNYYLYNITSFMAKSFFMLMFFIPAGVIFGIILVGLPNTFTIVQILPCLISIIGALLLSWCLYGILGLLAFWTQDSTPFGWIISKLFLLFGTFFPLEFFPTWLQPIIKYSPIYSIMSGPSSLVANFSWGLFTEVIISQVIWLTIIILLGLGIYNLGKRKVVANGG